MKVKVVYEYRSEGMHGFTTSFLPERCEIVNVRRYLFSSYGYDLIHDGKNIGHFIEMSVNDDKKNYTEDDQKVVVYDYYVYKIVRVDDSKGTKVSLKLWFLSDLNKKENK